MAEIKLMTPEVVDSSHEVDIVVIAGIHHNERSTKRYLRAIVGAWHDAQNFRGSISHENDSEHGKG